MKFLCFVMKVVVCLAISAALASADSIQLRNGRHLQGKYIGGTTSSVGFMTAGAVEYFATTDVLVIIFDNNESPLSGLQPNPMRGKALPQTRVQRINVSTRDRIRQPRARAAVATEIIKEKISQREQDLVQRKAVLVDSAWPTSSP